MGGVGLIFTLVLVRHLLRPRGHQLPKKGVRISKSVEFTQISLISRDFTVFKRFPKIF